MYDILRKHETFVWRGTQNAETKLLTSLLSCYFIRSFS